MVFHLEKDSGGIMPFYQVCTGRSSGSTPWYCCDVFVYTAWTSSCKMSLSHLNEHLLFKKKKLI